MTRLYYDGPGSFPRLLEAALAVAWVETDAPSDPEFHGACCRLRAAALAYAARRPAGKADETSQDGPGATLATDPGHGEDSGPHALQAAQEACG